MQRTLFYPQGVCGGDPLGTSTSPHDSGQNVMSAAVGNVFDLTTNEGRQGIGVLEGEQDQKAHMVVGVNI